jgi:hypothetical protein
MNGDITDRIKSALNSSIDDVSGFLSTHDKSITIGTTAVAGLLIAAREAEEIYGPFGYLSNYILHNFLPHAVISFAVAVNTYKYSRRKGMSHKKSTALGILAAVSIALGIESYQFAFNQNKDMLNDMVYTGIGTCAAVAYQTINKNYTNY